VFADYWTVNPSDTKSFEWSIRTRGSYNLDTGKDYLVIEHTLKALIYEDDEITFGLGFKVQSGGGNADIKFKYDAAECRVSVNTMDTDFWVQQSFDYSYTEVDGKIVYAEDTENNWATYEQDY